MFSFFSLFNFQVFSVLFFFMLFVLGIGSNIAMCSCIITAIHDQFPKWKPSLVVIAVATTGFLIGLFYITPVSKWHAISMRFFFLSLSLLFNGSEKVDFFSLTHSFVNIGQHILSLDCFSSIFFQTF